MPDAVPSVGEIRAALDELLGWQGISRSPQLADLLRYVVEKTLSGDEASIKAYSIAVDVFGRPADFDPQSDPIVRVQARRLRTLLEQFYANGSYQSAIQVRLPLGRYVPEFARLEKPAPEASPGAAIGGGPVASRRPRRFAGFALLGMVFMLLGVGLAILLIRWMVPQNLSTTGVGIPTTPVVMIGAFDNLTGEAVLDDDVVAVGRRLAEMLGKFDGLKVSTDAGGLLLRGTVQEEKGHFTVKAMLSRGDNNGVWWSSTVTPPAGTTDTAALTEAGLTLAIQLGSSSSPLHAPGRAWAVQRPALPGQPTLYVCQLLQMAWRDTMRLGDAVAGLDCLSKILAREPDNAVALAADAGLKAWRAQYEATPGGSVDELMAVAAGEVSRAVVFAPTSSFVLEEQGIVLARQRSFDAASGAFKEALTLNPANMDAQSAYAQLLWLDGQYDQSTALAEAAIAAVPSPPPWYYTTRAAESFRTKRYFDAIDAAQALAASDDELGPVIVLASAPQVGRNDLIDRYRPMIMGNPRLQLTGIMPRLAARTLPQAMLDRIRDGLVLSGVPREALDGPFNGGGTAKR